ncbi:ABC transporter ATP-binding protein [Lachnoclostridium sp. An181]|uniref:ABC transporter ATP-binding protein n=1 Tax=Lachnoclostridium sp. An181 TaxID=1965575 RepID=UPI000B370DAF|nr:ATP-binding cassette domain-containing protein [Lachnoclostridium sp. An181]OUP51335.1 hypothetical protein B5F18_01080 [Lachnoclostridium sp. An181]
MEIQIQNWNKAFGEHILFQNLNATFREGERYCLMGASGSGKTTFLRMLAGLERPDGGMCKGLKEKRISMVFQENRLCEGFNALDNIKMVLKRPEEGIIRRELAALLPEEYIEQPVYRFSGGMKRRVAVVRAILADSDLLLMDEPFTGLDESLKKQVMDYIMERQKNRIVIFTTHQEEDAEYMNAIIRKIYFTRNVKSM